MRDEAKRDSGKSVPRAVGPTGTERLSALALVPLDELTPDPENRVIDESEESFTTLVDSVRVMGILVALHAQRRGDGTLRLIDGERRWRAARKAGLAAVPCEVWPEHVHPRDVTLAGVVINEQREAHSCLAIARRLRAVKNQFAETQEQVAARTGLPLTRVKGYLNLFNASDLLLRFLDDADVSLRTAVELVRYEKVLGETAARRLLERHAEEPLTARDVEALRKRGESKAKEAADVTEKGDGRPRRGVGRLPQRMEALARKDPAGARLLLEAFASLLGLRLVEANGAS